MGRATSDPSREPRRWWPSRVAAAALIACATLAVYREAGSFDFVTYDDSDYVRQNVRVLEGPTPEGVAWAFTTFSTGNWHPLTWISLMVDARLGGGAPAAFHRTNVALHLAGALLLFLLFDRMTGAVWRSATAAALFAVHPLHVESVAWIAERKDVLSALFGLAALHAWIGALEGRRLARPAAVGAYAASLMAKPTLVTLPVLLLLLDLWPLGRAPSSARRGAWPAWLELLGEKTPFIVLAAVSSVVTLAAQSSGGNVRSLTQYPLSGRCANACVTALAYLGKAAWPAHLAVFYPYAYGGIEAAEVAAAVAVLAAASVAAVRLRRRLPYVTFGWLWYLVALAPVIGIVQVGSQAMADRYTYVPLVGPFVAVAWGAWDLVGRLPARAARPVAAALAASAVVPLAAVGARQASYWRDTTALFEHALAATDESAPAHSALATALYERGDVQGALEHCEAALRVAPDFAPVQAKLVRCLLALGKVREAGERAGAYLAAHPDDPDLVVNVGLVALMSGEREAAERRFREALALDPGNAVAHLNLGSVLLAAGRREEAVAQFEEAVRLHPNDPAARRALERARGTAAP